MDPVGSQPALGTLQQQRARAIDVHTSEAAQASVTVKTAEGDRITVGIGASDETRLSEHRYSSLERNESHSTLQEAVSRSSQAGLSLTVEGNLSETEVEDLSKLFSRIQEMASTFFSGATSALQNATAEATAELAESSTLSAFSVDLDYERTVATEVTTTAVDTFEVAPDEGAPPPTSVERTPTPPRRAAANQRRGVAGHGPMIQGILDTVRASQAGRAHLKNQIIKSVRMAFDGLQGSVPEGRRAEVKAVRDAVIQELARDSGAPDAVIPPSTFSVRA